MEARGMGSLCRAHGVCRPIPSPLPPLPLFKPLLSSAPRLPIKPSLTLRASRDSPPPPFFKPASLALAAAAAAAAVFLPRLSNPSFAAVPSPVPQSDTLRSDSSDADREKLLERRLAARPDDPDALRALMELKVKSRKLPEAVAIVDRLILLQPGEKELPLLKAHLQSYDGDVDAAKKGFEDVLAADPFAVEAYHGLVLLASRSNSSDEELAPIVKRIEGAIELCKKEKRNDELRDFKLLLAQIRVIEGSYEEALKIYRGLVKEEPRDFRPYLCQGIIYTLMRKKDEAEKQFEKYHKLVPKGHPYARYFEENVMAMNAFTQMDTDENEGESETNS